MIQFADDNLHNKTIMNEKILLINQTLKEIPFYGVTNIAFLKACKKLNITKSSLYFPQGIYDVILEFEKNVTNRMINDLEEHKEYFHQIKLRDQVQLAVKTRLLIYSEFSNYRELLLQIYTFYFLIQNSYFFLQISSEIVDNIWKITTDHCADFSYYTKRISLGTVYINTILYFIEDTSQNHDQTLQFLNRRIENIISFTKISNKFKKIFKNINLFNVDFNQ